MDLHALGGVAPGPRLKANVVGRRERETVAVPEGGVVAGMAVRVADEDVEDHAREELPKGFGRRGEARPDDVGERFVRCVGSEALVEDEQG